MDAEVAQVSGRLDLLLPVGTAQRLVGEQSAAEVGRQEPDAVQASRTASNIAVPVSVLVHRGRISLTEALNLHEGDVLPLGKPLDDPLTVALRGRAKFLAQAGTRAGRVAARILGPINGGAL